MIINAGGGGGLFPQLVISTEIGAVITATNGDQTLNKTADSETVIIDLPAYGTWTVTAVTSEVTVVETVEVDTVMQYELIARGYEQLINYNMLYYAGVENEITGGLSGVAYTHGTWSGSKIAPTVTKNTDNIVASNSSNQSGALATVNAIDLTEFSLACALASANCGAYSSSVFHITTNKVNSSGNVANANVDICRSSTATSASTEKNIVSIDISDISGNHYLSFVHVSTNSVKTTVYAVALLKADDITTLCTKAGLTAPTDLATLIADSASIESILNSKDAVGFMTKQCTGDFMASFVESENCLTALDASPYKATIQANEHWAKFLAMVA